MLKILITGGGTRVPIDDIRYIGNQGTGSFPSKITNEFLELGHHVDFLGSESGIFPCMIRTATCSFKLKYNLNTYVTYDEYRTQLLSLLEQKPDIVFLGAAVSDYVCDPIQGKIRSGDDLTIKLRPAEKLINRVKDISPNSLLVGFKLLYNVSRQELISAARQQIEKAGSDIVIANDYKLIKDGRPEILFVSRGQESVITGKYDSNNMAAMVVQYVLENYT